MSTTITGDYSYVTGDYSYAIGSKKYFSEPEQFLTRKQLKDYLSGKEVTKEVFDFVDERVPFGTDTLGELNKAGITSDFIKKLNRERKLKRILK